MSYTITIINNDIDGETPIYTQMVDQLNLKEILAAVNAEPKRPRSDKGVARSKTTETQKEVKA